MKFLIMILALLISIQPLQAESCDMEKSQDVTHHMDHFDEANHKCCDFDDSNFKSGCESMTQCGSTTASILAVPSILKYNAYWPTDYSHELCSGYVPSIHSKPPFRPPIA